MRAKLVQAYSIIGDVENRKIEIKGLVDARKSKKHPDLSQTAFFIRDQFIVDGAQIFVFDYYDLNPEWSLGSMYWEFYIKDNNSDDNMFISLGSYDATTLYSRATEEIKEDERIYHLDGYWDSGKHSTYDFYN